MGMRSIVHFSVLLIVMVVVVATAGAGCSNKPPREIDAAVRNRLTRYSDAWKRGDAAGVRDSFAPRNADEVALVGAMAELAPAQLKLRTAYYEALGPTGRIIFGEGDVASLMRASSRWDSYARSAAHPHALVYKKPRVLVQLEETDNETIVPARNVDGGDWKLELDGFIRGRDVAELAAVTQRQVRQANDMTAAVRTGDPKEVQREMLRQITDDARGMRGPLADEMQKILGDGSGATTRPAAP
jgi:hypothetical protein